MAETYNTSIAKARNVEFIHLSMDNSDDAMAGFMKAGPFAFPGIPEAKWKKQKLLGAMAPNGVPHYKLVDSTGKVIAEGAEAKEKAKELAASSSSPDAKPE